MASLARIEVNKRIVGGVIYLICGTVVEFSSIMRWDRVLISDVSPLNYVEVSVHGHF